MSDAELEAMLTLDGVDAVLPGPCVVAGSLGYPADWDHPEACRAVARITEADRRTGKPFGVPGQFHDDQLIHLSCSDIGVLRRGLEEAIAEWKTQRKPAMPAL